MKLGKKLKRVICLMLCVVLAFGAVAAFASCDNASEQAEPTETTDPNAAANLVQVVRVVTSITAGTKLVREDLQEVMVDKEFVPAGAATSISDIVNQFTKVNLYSGDFVLTEKISKSADFGSTVETVHEDYVVVTDYITAGERDIAKCIQKAVDENPNKTIYIPDGSYLLQRPIKTSADPAKAVSFQLSNYAHISTIEAKWEGGDAIFELGALDSDMGAKYSIVGGIIGGGGVAGGFCVKGGNALINNFSLKQVTIGLQVKEGARADIDSGVVIGAGSSHDGAIGVLIESDECTVTNMRLDFIWVGIRVTGKNNTFRNLHPLYQGSENNTSCGFWDTGDSNFFDVCYSDQLAIGFRVGPNTSSIFNGCFVMWYNGDYSNGVQYGFQFDGQMNSIIRDTKVSIDWSKPDTTYVKIAEEGGCGVILYPRISSPAMDKYLEVKDGKVVGGAYFDYVKTEFLK